MTRKQELIREANIRYKSKDKVICLKGSFPSYSRRRDYSDSHYAFTGDKDGSKENSYHYDEQEDTLCNWGRGIGLIYRKGEWALKEGGDKPKVDNYEIY